MLDSLWPWGASSRNLFCYSTHVCTVCTFFDVSSSRYVQLQRYNLISFISGQPEEQESIFRHQSGEGIRRLHLCAHPAAPRRDKLHWIKLAIRMLQVCGDLLNFCYMHSTMIMHLSDLLNTRKIPLHFNVMILLTSISNHTSTRSLGHFKPHIP